MLNRKRESDIKKWLNEDKNALLIYGARQVGKTFLIRKVLKEMKVNFCEFNLIKNPKIINILSKCTNTEEIIRLLSVYTIDKIKPGSVIFFDEIQEYKEIVTKIKFLVDDGSYKYILSGSLLGVEITGLKSAPVGYLKSITMYPLTFEEFLQIYNIDEDLIKLLKASFDNKVEVNDIINNKMLEVYKQYLIVGGMPSAVMKFINTNDIKEVIEEHNSIIEQYKQDFTKYELNDKKLMLRNIYDLIPSELNKQNKRFNFSDIKKQLRYEKVENSFLWLSNSGVGLPVFNVEDLSVPLKISEKRSLFKFFLSDVGMLSTLFGISAKQKILNEEPINNGCIYENFIAQELYSKNYDVYYYNNKKKGELDFVIEYHGDILAIEVKSGKNYKRHNALKNVNTKHSLVFTNSNVKTLNNITYLPIYMIMFVTEDDIELPLLKLVQF